MAGSGGRGARDRDAGAAPGRDLGLGAVVLDADGRAFAQRRSPGRRLFRDCWDIVGGHVEPGGTLLAALAREVEVGSPMPKARGETGWRLPPCGG
ncbi:NUDIX domain-containing protein [Actinacidiphila glaucinigra]|uniref:NUDIX domain-containing protein n=1 Tax=Actinacidiphila glaucinigra TaxID=235986 RepID=UPI003716ECDD